MPVSFPEFTAGLPTREQVAALNRLAEVVTYLEGLGVAPPLSRHDLAGGPLLMLDEGDPLSGPQGPPGYDGEDGEPSMVPGLPGTPGATGATGIGIPGLDGEDGRDGFPIPGRDGTGLPPGFSVDTFRGPPGMDGEDGDSNYASIPPGSTKSCCCEQVSTSISQGTYNDYQVPPDVDLWTITATSGAVVFTGFNRANCKSFKLRNGAACPTEGSIDAPSTITLLHESTDSTSGNRITTVDEEPLIIAPGQTVEIKDITTAWVPGAGEPAGSAYPGVGSVGGGSGPNGLSVTKTVVVNVTCTSGLNKTTEQWTFCNGILIEVL